MRNFKINIPVDLLIFAGWLLTVLSFLKYIPLSLTLILALLTILQMLVIINNIRIAVYYLPYAMLLSPLFGAIGIGGLNVIFSDLFVVFALVVMIVKRHPIKHSRSFYFLFGALLFFSCIHLLVGDIISFKPLISIIQIFAVYIVVKYCFEKLNLNKFLNSVFAAVFLGILLMFLAFYQGINLNDYSGNSTLLLEDAADFDSSKFRMTYFYTNFPFLIASAFFIMLYRFKTTKTQLLKPMYMLSMSFLGLALVASGNKTTLFTTIIVFLLTMIMFDLKRLFKITSLVYLLLFLFVIYYLISSYFLNESNADLFVSRMMSGDSLNDRFGVYVNVFHLIIESPHRILVGYGPDFLTAGGNAFLSKPFKINYFTKLEQGTVDSGIISLILDFGILLFFIIIIPIIRLMRKLAMRASNDNIMIIQIFMVFIISGFTQIIGLSKIFWFFVIVFALGKTILKMNRWSKRENLAIDKQIFNATQ